MLLPLSSYFGKRVISEMQFTTIETLHKRHNVSNHRRLDRLFNNLFMLPTKGLSRLCITGPLWRITGGFPSKSSGNTESLSMSSWPSMFITMIFVRWEHPCVIVLPRAWYWPEILRHSRSVETGRIRNMICSFTVFFCLRNINVFSIYMIRSHENDTGSQNASSWKRRDHPTYNLSL